MVFLCFSRVKILHTAPLNSFFFLNLHSVPHNGKVKTILEMSVNLLKRKNGNHIYISIQTLYSVLSWSTYGRNYSLESFWVWHNKICTPGLGDFLTFFFANPFKLGQVAQPLLCYLGCVLRVIVMLEGEPSAPVWGPEVPWNRFSLRTSLYEAATSTLYFWDGTLQVMSRAVFLQTRDA